MMHDCPCCGHAVYAFDPLCLECQDADCQPNGEGVYDSCELLFLEALADDSDSPEHRHIHEEFTEDEPFKSD